MPKSLQHVSAPSYAPLPPISSSSLYVVARSTDRINARKAKSSKKKSTLLIPDLTYHNNQITLHSRCEGLTKSYEGEVQYNSRRKNWKTKTRSEGNPLDLNNLPEDYFKDGKQVLEDSSSSSGYRKKKSSTTDEKDECGKVYECRFCSVKFCKSQALGGHMNRHRQERETETLNKARHLVFTSDLAPGAHHLGYVSSGQPIPHGNCYRTGNIMGDPTVPFRSIYPTRMFSGSIPAQYPGPLVNDYFVAGNVLSGNSRYSNSKSSYSPAPQGSNFTCVGAPVGHGFPNGNESCSRGQDGVDDVRDMSLHNQEEGLDWDRR
ncbi:zinc finger protein JAGGED-like [Forsythia ovata]|uniref:Zinc finger protein JAGGED-like n=1 Tax=Forsythia ovata TaxID=205694 RepID=A0ABD1XAK2_9LAMI